jgi:hypothetical protein
VVGQHGVVQVDQRLTTGRLLDVKPIYMDTAVNQLRAEGFDVRPEDVARLSALGSTTST